MSTNNSLTPIFADISVLIEYCSSYFEEQHYADRVLNQYCNDGGQLVVSESAWLALNSGMANRERLWDYLLEEATRYMKEEELSATDFRSDILNYTSIDQAFEFEVDQGYLPDLKALRQEFEQSGLSEFRQIIDTARQLCTHQRLELETTMDISDYTRGSSRGSWMNKSSISQHTAAEYQTESLMDYGYWRRENNGIALLGSMCKAAESKESVCEVLSEISNSNVTVLTPEDVAEQTSVFG